MGSRKTIKQRESNSQDWGNKAYQSDGDYTDMINTPTEAGVFPRFQPEPFSEGKKAYDDLTGLDFATQEDNYVVPDGIPEFSWPPQPADKRFQGKQPALRFQLGFSWMYCDGRAGTADWCPGDLIDFFFDEYFTDPIVRIEIDGPAAFSSGHPTPNAETPDSQKVAGSNKGQHRLGTGGEVPAPYKVSVKVDTSPPEGANRITVNCYTRSGWRCSATADRKDICGGCGSAEIGIAGIHYTTTQMACGESQTFTVINPETGTTYKWECTTGSLTPSTGDSTVYTAPATNASCLSNATVTLKANGNTCDFISVAVNCISAHSGYAAYEVSTCFQETGGLLRWFRRTYGYWCDGTVVAACNPTTSGGWWTENECLTDAGAGNVCCPCFVGVVGTHDCRGATCSDLLTSGCCPEVLI
jgi:hypothetical protein